jgi:muramoyltetrapeptide carboxypeptidase LdcA involved in peptidoglycan recycling
MIPPRLRPGATIGIVSPSWGGAGAFPHRVRNGVAYLQSQGFEVELSRHALEQHGHVSDTAENRAADLHEMFERSHVAAIIAAIGGDHSCHLLPHIDFDLIRENPTIFMGYSDITVLNVAIWHECGLVTFNGPALITDFAEHPEPLAYTVESFARTVQEAEPVGRIAPSSQWTEEILNWREKLDLTRPRRLEESPGWSWLRPGAREGVLVGGCIESLQHLRGTPYWPDLEGAILFLETSEEAPSPARVDGILMDYENMGILSKLAGLLFGRPMGYSESDKEALRQVIMERTAGFDLPVIADMDFGHTAPQFLLPIGCRARIDSEEESFSILQAAVS